jgi:carboxypeptidase family protein
MGRGRWIALLAVLGLGVAWLWRNAAAPRVEAVVETQPVVEEVRPESELSTPGVQPVAVEREARIEADPDAKTVRGSRGPAARTRSGAPITGRVVRPDGTPVVDAQVVLECAEPYRSRLAPLDTTRTDARGHFALDCGRSGPFRVEATERVDERVVGQVAREDVFPNRGPLELVLVPALVHGRVVDDAGNPVTDYQLAWTPLPEVKGRPPEPGERIHSASGEFTTPLSPGAWRANASVPQLALQPASIELSVPSLETVVIVLARQGVVRGTVLDAADEPVSAARITLDGRVRTTSGSRGTFEIEVTPGAAFTLAARHDRHAPSEPVELSLEPGEERDELILRLGASARVTGEVIDPQGRPVAGRRVMINRQVSGSGMVGVEVETDASGRFETQITPGFLCAWIEFEDDELEALGRPRPDPGASRPSWTRSVILGAGESAHLRFVMGAAPVRLHGRIDVGGKAPANALLCLRGFMGSSEQALRTSDGRYEFLVPEPGCYMLSVTADDQNVQPLVEVPEGREHRFDLSIPLGRVSG